MASQDYLQSRKLAKKTVIEQGVDDTPVGIRIKHTSTDAITSVTISQAADTLVLIDATTTVTITFTDAASNTVGEVVDQVNAAANWEASILDAKRTDTTNTNDIFMDGAITASVYDGVTYYDVLMDTSNYKAMAKRLVFSRHTETGGRGEVDKGHRVRLKEVTYNLTLGGGADTNALKIYDVDGATETEIWRSTPTSGSATNLWSNVMLYNADTGITVKEGRSILVQITDGTSVTGSMHLVGDLE